VKRSLLILLIILAVVLVYTVIVIPVIDRHRDIVDELQLKSETLGKYRLFLETATETKEALKNVEEELKSFNSLLIDADSDAIGFSRLNSHVQNLIRKSGMEVISIKSLNVVKYKLYVGLPIQINATADVRQVKEFLQSMSSGKYLISIDLLNIRVVNIRKPDKLRVKIQISGYREK
jgi:Tfp pilus assembly protein PilO